MADLLNPFAGVEASAPQPTQPDTQGLPVLPPGVIPDEEKYTTPGQQLATVGEGLGKGLLGPVFTGAEKLLGVQHAKEREEYNPGEHYTAEAAGLLAPALATAGLSAEARAALEAPESISTAAKLARFTQAGLLGKAGETAAAKLGLEGATATAAKMGLENAIFQGGDELSKAIQGNPDNIQTAAIHVGLSGLLGAGLGAGLGKISELWKAKVGPEADQFVQDFQSRMQAHAADEIPTGDAVFHELSEEYGRVNDAMEGLRGAGGLKSQDIGKLLPEESNPAQYAQGADILQEADEALGKAHAEPGIYTGARFDALRDYSNRLASILQKPELTSQEIFQALDDFKKGLGAIKSFSPFSPEVEKPGAALLGKLYHTVRVGLEDPEVWGSAGERQAAINKLFTEHIPASEDFRRTFTEKIGGEPQVSPGKVQTLVNGIGNPKAEIKLDKLANYLDANDKLYEELQKIHNNLGVENPYQRPPLANTRAILNDITPGMKAADFVRLHALNSLSELAGGGVGATIGHMSGLPLGDYLGYKFGHYALKPIMKTIMPTLIKPLMAAGPSGEGLRAAFDTLGAVMKGEHLANDATKAVFQTGMAATLAGLTPSREKLEKLDEKLSNLQGNTNAMLEVGGKMSHYMPAQATATAATAQNAINYITSQRPGVVKNGMLDRTIPPNHAQMSAYMRTLKIAEQPLVVLKSLKDGSLKPKDIQDLKAIYPALYSHLSDKLIKAQAEHLAKEGQIPFIVRKGLSQFYGAPVDSTFTPASIQAAQATFMPKQAPQQPKPPPGRGKSLSKLGKSVELAKTPSEARQSTLAGR